MKLCAGFCGLFLAFTASIGSAATLGTAFTYHGRLTDNGSPANGRYDLRFVLYDADSGGNQFGPILTNTNMVVSSGVFIATLDFGSVFDGNGRWLEISVRTNGASNFATLAPRQNLTPIPYALTAIKLAGILPDNQLSANIARVDAVGASLGSATNALLAAVTNIFSSGAGNLNASALTSGTVPNARLTGVTITNGTRYFWDTVLEPYWTFNQYGRATLLDMTDRPLLTLRHNDIGTNNDVIYIGGVSSWDAASVQMRGVEDGNSNARFTIVIGSSEQYTWRFRETNLNNGADINLLSHDNNGNVVLGNTNGAGTVRGTNVILQSVLTSVTGTLAVGGCITNPAGPGIYFGATNNPTFPANDGSLYLTGASNGVMYFRSSGAWHVK
jgi:hypothetical protein